MTSRRFPGKVLAPLYGRPILSHVVDRVGRVVGRQQVVVLTSVDPTDDPVALYGASLGIVVFRGPLDDVFDRFRLCAEAHPSEWILRISADSPVISASLLERVVAVADATADIVTTIHPRTFPKGQNAEAIRASVLVDVDPTRLSDHDREHVTPFFYRHDREYRIRSVTSGQPEPLHLSYAVDTPEDLQRLEQDPALADLDRLIFA